MNTKYLRWALVIILAVVGLAAVLIPQYFPQGAMAKSAAVQVPVAVNTAIQIGIILLLTLGFEWLFKVFGLDMRELAPVIGLALSTFITVELQNLINLIPAAWDPIVNTFFYFLVLILAPIGGMRLISRKEPQDLSLL